jgi:phospholipase C
MRDHNPNVGNAPFRLDRSQNYTCDMNHDYTPEQQAFDTGLMDKFPEFTATPCTSIANLAGLGAQVVMGYYDGNTVTGMWNLAQHFALNDNSFGTTFGPSTPGAVNMASGMTGNVDLAHSIDDSSGDLESDVVNAAIIGDPDPYYDDCGSPDQTSLKGKNIGDLLNAKGVSWGWFQGGFKPSTAATATTPAVCATTTNRLDGTPETAYSAHHDPFEYYASTANIHHTPPSGVWEVGHNGQANHQYDIEWFWKAAFAGNLPAVSILKAPRANDGHPSNSSPLDEQLFILSTIDALELLPEWKDTAVIIAWDDSDGWYDHVIGPIVNQSTSSADALTASGACGNGANALAGLQSRCGYGPRLPFLVISPYARENFVDSTLTDQSSITRFIEDNWGTGRIGTGSFDQVAGSIEHMFDFSHRRAERVLFNPKTGEVLGFE